MDPFTDDLSSPLPKQMGGTIAEIMQTPLLSVVTTNEDSASTAKRASEREGRSVIARRPLSECLGRIALKRILARALATHAPELAAEDPFRQLSDDVLELILARLPLSFPLKSARKVCKRWEAAVNTPHFDNLHKQLGESQPWLVCYGDNELVPSKSQGFAYDVESHAWIMLPSLQFPPHNSGSLAGASGLVYAIAGPGEDRLWYKLTGAASSSSAFEATWYETPAMGFPRSAPVVSIALGSGRTHIGHKVVVAGGVSEFEDEHMAVEVFDSAIGAWESYGDLPEEFADRSSRTWMSGVLCDDKFYVSVMHGWPIHVLDLCSKQWASLQLARPQGLIYHHVMAVGTALVVAGLCRADDDEQLGEYPTLRSDSDIKCADGMTTFGDGVRNATWNSESDLRVGYAVKLWKVDLQARSLVQIGLMPRQLFATLGSSSTTVVPKLHFLMNENLVYVSMEDGELVMGEISLEDRKTCWRGLPSLSALGYKFDSVVTFCASISNNSGLTHTTPAI